MVVLHLIFTILSLGLEPLPKIFSVTQFDEICIKGRTDSTIINISVKKDSIIVFESQKTHIDSYGAIKIGPRARAYYIIDRNLWKSIKGLLEVIIYNRIEPERMSVTHIGTNVLEVINKNRLIKEYFYYDIDGEVINFVDLTRFIYKSVSNGKKQFFEITSRLSNLSSITGIDSIIVYNLEVRKNSPPFNYDVLIETGLYSSIVDKQLISKVLYNLSSFKIVPAGISDSLNTKTNQRYRLYLYRTGVSTTYIDTNDPFLYYNRNQWLVMDPSFIESMK